MDVIKWIFKKQGSDDCISLCSVLWRHLSTDPTGQTAYEALTRKSMAPDPTVDRLVLWLTDRDNKEAARKFAEGFLACFDMQEKAVEAAGAADLEVEVVGGTDLEGADLGVEEQQESQKPPSMLDSDDSLGGLGDVGQSSSQVSESVAKSLGTSKFDFRLQKLDFDQRQIREELERVQSFYGKGQIKDFTPADVKELPELKTHAYTIYKEMKAGGAIAFQQDPHPKNMRKTSKNIVCEELAHYWKATRTGNQWKKARGTLTSQDWASVAIASIVYLFALRDLNKATSK